MTSGTPRKAMRNEVWRSPYSQLFLQNVNTVRANIKHRHFLEAGKINLELFNTEHHLLFCRDYLSTWRMTFCQFHPFIEAIGPKTWPPCRYIRHSIRASCNGYHWHNGITWRFTGLPLQFSSLQCCPPLAPFKPCLNTLTPNPPSLTKTTSFPWPRRRRGTRQ